MHEKKQASMSLKMQQTVFHDSIISVDASQGGVLAGDGGQEEKWKEPFFCAEEGCLHV